MAKLQSISLAGSNTPASLSSLQITQQSFNLGVTEDGVYGVQFTCTDDGRGTGAQFVPLDRLEDFCDVLEGFADPDSLTGKQASTDPVSVMRDTMALVTDDKGVGDGRVSFRTQLGQGQKPTRLNQSEIPAVVAYLRSQIAPSLATVEQVKAKAKKG